MVHRCFVKGRGGEVYLNVSGMCVRLIRWVCMGMGTMVRWGHEGRVERVDLVGGLERLVFAQVVRWC